MSTLQLVDIDPIRISACPPIYLVQELVTKSAPNKRGD